MAKKKEVIITCNATNVKAVIEGLERGMAALAKEEENLLNVIKQRGYAEDAEKKRLKELEKAMDAMRTNIQKPREEMKKLGEVMKDLAGSKLKDLKKALQEGKAALNNMSERDPKRKQLVDDLKKIQMQMAKLTGDTNKFGATHNAVWQTAVRNITAYMGGFAAFNFVKNKMTEMVRKNYELSDAIMNVRKVSGLAVEDVNQLYENLTKIDTRNTVNTLMDLAYQGGKLGIGNYGVEGLTGFVKAAEQVQMALGEEMGEEALPAMAKLTENMDLIRKYGVEEAMQKTASAIFQLYTTSVSTGTGIVDFAKRLMPVAKAAGVTTDELLGLASATESSGLAAEVSATAFAKMFPSIYKNADAIEKFLNIEKGTIRTMYDQNQAMQAMVMIFDKMQGLGNLNKYPEIFKLLGSEGARMTSVMTAMANNVDMLRTHLKTSTEAFVEGTAVINEYELQNASAAAVLERANNIWEKAFVNPEGVDMVKKLAEEWYNLSKELTGSETWMTSAKTSLSAIAGVVGILIKLLPTLLKAFMFYGAAQAIRKLWVEFTALNGAMAAANTQAARLSALMKSNVWVLGATAIAFAVSYLVDMAEASKDAANGLGVLEQAEKEAKEESIRQRAELKKLYDATQDQTKSIEDRKKALKDMVGDAKYKEYYEKLVNEKNIAELAAGAYRDLTDEIIKSARARAYSNKITKLEEERMKLEDKKEEKEEWREENKDRYTKNKEAYKNQQDYVESATSAISGFPEAAIAQRGASAMKPAIIDEYETTERDITKIDTRISEIGKDMDKLKNKIEELNLTPKSDGGGGGGGGGGNTGDTDEQKRQEAKQAMRKEMQDAQKESTGVLSKLEEWYRLQEAAITEARADGKMTEEQAAQMVRTLGIIKNESRATARRAITTGETDAWDKLKSDVMPKAMADASELSANLLETIQNVPVQVLHKNLAKFNGSEDVFGLDSRAFFDQINAKAAGNTREAARLRSKLFKQTEKLLEQYEVIRVAQKKMQTDLEGIGLYTETYEEFAQRMQQGITEKQPKQLKNGKTITDEEAYGQMGAKFIGQGTIPYYINIENADEALHWIHQFATNAQGELEDWAQAFPDIERWVTLLQRKNELQNQGNELTQEELEELSKIPEELAKAIPTIKAMFYQLEQSAGSVAETIRKQVDAMMGGRAPIGIDEMRSQYEKKKSLTEQEWDKKISAARDNGQEDTAIELEKQKKQQLIELEHQYQEEIYQIQSQMRNTWADEYEHEVEQYKYMLDKKLISEKQFQKKKAELQAKLGIKYGQQFNGMMSDLVDAMQDYEIAAVEAKYDAEISAARTAGQDTAALEEQKEEEIYNVRKKYAALQLAVKISEIIMNTAAGVMMAFASLPTFLAIPAAAMISATGALQVAIAKAEYNKVMAASPNGTKSSSAATAKTKGVSGMLTYDEGNVHRFIGQDGKVYTATEEPAPKDGLVTHPIATTVQGQPALVAEKGPEIVIGRETTRAIQMNEPELIRYLATYQQHSGIGYRQYDSGNLGSEGLRVNGEESAADNGQSSMDNGKFLQVMQAVLFYLKHPVRPKINMYSQGGEDGLYDDIKKAEAFMSKYERH